MTGYDGTRGSELGFNAALRRLGLEVTEVCGVRQRLPAMAWLLALLLGPLDASAATSESLDRTLIRVPELIVPDLGWEFGPDHGRLVLSVPLTVLWPLRYPHRWDFDRGWVHLLAEPQWVPRASIWRGLLGVRYHVPLFETAHNLAAFTVVPELSGIVGTDSSGGSVGVAIRAFDGRFISVIGVGYRFVLTHEEQRHELTLDLVNVAF